MSPHLIVFGTLPRQGLISIYEGHEQIFEGKNDYIKSLILLNDSFSKIRLAQIESRQYKPNLNKVENYFDKIQIGSIISIKNLEIKVKKQDFKLRPRFKNRFLEIRRSKSACYVKQLCDVYLKQFLSQRTRGEEVEPTFAYKVDISEVKLLTNIHLITSNQRDKFYENFVKSHEVPEAMYFNQSGTDAFEGTVQGQSALKKPYKTDIKQIAEMFRNIQGNRHPLQRAV